LERIENFAVEQVSPQLLVAGENGHSNPRRHENDRRQRALKCPAMTAQPSADAVPTIHVRPIVALGARAKVPFA
jgi:hypothetical protein